MENAQTDNKSGFWELLTQIQSEHGLIVLVLLMLIGLVCLLFWKLIWNVWDGALQAKEDEIGRLAKERDTYQALVFERLRSSGVSMVKEQTLSGTRHSE
jgi:hypothetical protein